MVSVRPPQPALSQPAPSQPGPPGSRPPRSRPWPAGPPRARVRWLRAGGAALLAGCLLAGGAAAAETGTGTGTGHTVAPVVADQPAAGGYRWPLERAEVVRRFDPPPRRWLPGHRGVDLAAGEAEVVRAAGAGTVVFAGPVGGRPVVSVRHPGGLRTTYQPVAPSVAAGDAVRAGDPIGVLVAGHAGCPAAACLHWGLRRGDHYLDPLLLVGHGRVRLLPG